MTVNKRRKSKNIDNALFPMKIANSVIGCGVIEYPLGNPHMIISYIYSSILLIAFCLLLYLAVHNREYEISSNLGNSSNVLYIIATYLNTLIVFTTIVMSWFQKHKLKLFIQKVKEADEYLSKLGISKNYGKIYKRQLLLVAFVIIINVTMIIVNWKMSLFNKCISCDVQVKIVFSIRYYYSLMLQYFNDFHFIGLIWCLKYKFEQLNSLLGKLSETSEFLPQYMKLIYFKTGLNKAGLIKKTNDDTNIIRISKQVHLDLVRLCRLSNDIFSFHLLMSITFATTEIIAHVYITYTEYTLSVVVNKYNQLIKIFTILVFFGAKIWTINYICEKTSYEAQITGSIINELYEPATNKEFREEIREFTIQLLQNPLTFTAHGFFNLDNTCIQKVVGSITTFLIILIQLRDMANQ